MADRPTLYIFCGLPFSGKTTAARELARRLGYPRIDLDEINTRHGRGLGAVPIAPYEWTETYEESYQDLDALLSEGSSVIYDATNFTREQRDRLRGIADARGAATRVIYLDVPEAEARALWRRNRETRARYDVRDEDYALVVDNFQAPDDDENVVRYDPRMGIERLIRRL